jgi:quinol monooxygenase YgiN
MRYVQSFDVSGGTMSKVAVVAKITSKEGLRDDLVALFQSHVDVVRDEPGTLTYALHTDVKDPNVIWFYELYADHDALKAHGGADAMKALGPKIGPLMAGRAEITLLDPIVAKGL